MSRVQITARATVVVEIAVDDSWGTDCAMNQIVDQATRSAEAKIRTIKGFTKIRGIEIKALIANRDGDALND